MNMGDDGNGAATLNPLQVNVAPAYNVALGELNKEDKKRKKRVKKVIDVIGRAVVSPWIPVSLQSPSNPGQY